jgi:hypothetical protein
LTVLPFREDLVQYFADHRLPGVTPVLQGFTALGEIQGYILLIALVFVAYDKRLAIRLAVLTLVTMSFNHIIKTLIANPRPFMGDGSYLQKWAVSPERAADLATEYSTPSGHAMAAGGFYGYLVLTTRDPRWRALFVALAVLIGLSRPYLACTAGTFSSAGCRRRHGDRGRSLWTAHRSALAANAVSRSCAPAHGSERGGVGRDLGIQRVEQWRAALRLRQLRGVVDRRARGAAAGGPLRPLRPAQAVRCTRWRGMRSASA